MFPIITPCTTRIPPHGLIMEHKKSLESQQQKTIIQADHSTDKKILGKQNLLHGSVAVIVIVIVIVDRANNG
jgi:hypothetical protein